MEIAQILQRKYFLLLTLLASIVGIYSCQTKDPNGPEQRIKDFAQSYFNLRYRQALGYCTDESKKWVEYRASNISQSDLDIINGQTDTATCEIDNIETKEEGYAIAYITIRNVLVCDSIGKAGRMCKEIHKLVPIREKKGKWYVDLSCPL